MPWDQQQKEKWLSEQKIQRSYLKDAVTQVTALAASFDVALYGALSLDPGRYPLYLVKSKNWNLNNRTILITGGVHGYETSGVHGALSFLKREALRYVETFNIAVAPCLSPWGYETINRWNQKAIDPNRSFKPESPAEECQLFLNAMNQHGIQPFAHIDLHETTDTDNTVFRPALEARDGVPQELWDIPDGFYVVGDSENSQAEFQKAVIDSVRKVTHIAPTDSEGRLIGEKIEQEGVINYPVKKLFLCTGFSQATYTTTTEVYPDSPRVTPQNCIDAQVAAITGALDFLKHR